MEVLFNVPYYNSKCIECVKNTYNKRTQSGDGYYSKEIYKILTDKYGFKNSLLTTSCTHSLEMMAILLNINKDDEIIIPSYTFVSTANAFAKYGAKIILTDSLPDNPNIDPKEIEKNITDKTKAVCIVHYAGVGCNMEEIINICSKYNIILLEDAAQCINSFYNGRPLGSFGAMSAFSFHETKNIGCGEGGLLVINDEKYIDRAEIIREKGTNRSKFLKGELEKYQWVDIGSSYLLSDINAAYLYPQIQDIENITKKRISNKKLYLEKLKDLSFVDFKVCHDDNESNAHIFYLLFDCKIKRDMLKDHLRNKGIYTTTHYIPLHTSKYYIDKYKKIELPYSEYYGDGILRLPLHNELNDTQINYICDTIHKFYVKLTINIMASIPVKNEYVFSNKDISITDQAFMLCNSIHRYFDKDIKYKINLFTTREYPPQEKYFFEKILDCNINLVCPDYCHNNQWFCGSKLYSCYVGGVKYTHCLRLDCDMFFIKNIKINFEYDLQGTYEYRKLVDVTQMKRCMVDNDFDMNIDYIKNYNNITSPLIEYCKNQHLELFPDFDGIVILLNEKISDKFIYLYTKLQNYFNTINNHLIPATAQSTMSLIIMETTKKYKPFGKGVNYYGELIDQSSEYKIKKYIGDYIDDSEISLIHYIGSLQLKPYEKYITNYHKFHIFKTKQNNIDDVLHNYIMVFDANFILGSKESYYIIVFYYNFVAGYVEYQKDVILKKNFSKKIKECGFEDEIYKMILC